MSFTMNTTTMYGILEPDDIIHLDKKRCINYWNTFIKNHNIENLSDMENEFLEDPTGFIEDFENENCGTGPFSFMAYVLQRLDNTEKLNITYTVDDNNGAIGVFERSIFPWEAAELAKQAEINNITFDYVTDTLSEHYTMLFGKQPEIDDISLIYSD